MKIALRAIIVFAVMFGLFYGLTLHIKIGSFSFGFESCSLTTSLIIAGVLAIAEVSGNLKDKTDKNENTPK